MPTQDHDPRIPDDETLRYNPQTDCYERVILVPTLIQVEAKIYKQVVFAKLMADEKLDLSDRDAVSAAIADLGSVRKWRQMPATKFTTLTSVPAQLALPTPAPAPRQQPPPAPVYDAPTPAYDYLAHHQGDTRIDRLKARLMHIPPHQWWLKGPIDELNTAGLDKKQRDVIYASRNRDRTLIEQLRQKLQKGEWQLTPEAQQLEDEFNQQEQEKLTVKIETVAETVNSAGHK